MVFLNLANSAHEGRCGCMTNKLCQLATTKEISQNILIIKLNNIYQNAADHL